MSRMAMTVTIFACAAIGLILLIVGGRAFLASQGIFITVHNPTEPSVELTLAGGGPPLQMALDVHNPMLTSIHELEVTKVEVDGHAAIPLPITIKNLKPGDLKSFALSVPSHPAGVTPSTMRVEFTYDDGSSTLKAATQAGRILP